jgi:hypothetical protein
MGLPEPVAVTLPGCEVTVQTVIGLPPFDGSLKLTVAWALPAFAVTPAGAPGTLPGAVGVTLLEDNDGGPVPIPLVAVTVNV